MKYSRKWYSLIGLSLVSFTAFLDFSIVTTAIPFIQQAFHVGVMQLQWVSTIFTIMLALTMILAGRLGDRFGRLRIFYFGFVFFAVAAVGAAMSQNITQLIVFRGVQGLTAAIIFTLSVALLPAAFPAEEQDKAIGIYSMFTGVGVAVGPFLGGVIIQYLSWRYVFWVNVPVIFVGLLCCLVGLKSDKVQPSEERFDFVGYALFAVAVILLICGIVYEPQQATHHIAVIALIAAVVIFAIFAVVQLRVKHPFMEITVFANKYTFAALLVCIAACVVTNVFFFFDPLYLKIIRQLPAKYIGLILVTMPLMQVFISMFFERIIARLGVYVLLLIGMSAALVSALLNITFSFNTSYVLIVLTLLVMGISWGVANTGSIAAVSKHIAEEKAGAAIGSIFTFWNLMGAAFLASTSAFFVAQQNSHLHTALKASKLHLNAAQQQLLLKSIHDPSRAQIILTHLKDKSHALYHYFADSFLYALHAVSILMSTVLFLVLICGVVGKYRKS